MQIALGTTKVGMVSGLGLGFGCKQFVFYLFFSLCYGLTEA